jgi:hypothetical protein
MREIPRITCRCPRKEISCSSIQVAHDPPSNSSGVCIDDFCHIYYKEPHMIGQAAKASLQKHLCLLQSERAFTRIHYSTQVCRQLKLANACQSVPDRVKLLQFFCFESLVTIKGRAVYLTRISQIDTVIKNQRLRQEAISCLQPKSTGKIYRNRRQPTVKSVSEKKLAVVPGNSTIEFG